MGGNLMHERKNKTILSQIRGGKKAKHNQTTNLREKKKRQTLKALNHPANSSGLQ